MGVEDDKPLWHHLSVFHLLMTVGGAAAVLVALAFIVDSAASGVGYLRAILIS